MSLALVADLMLVVLVVGLAFWVNAATEAFSAIVGYVAFGLLLALAWLRLMAGDVALTEASVGSGVTGAVLIIAAGRLKTVETPVPAPGRGLRLAALLLSGLVTAALAGLVLWTTGPAPSLAEAAAEHLPSLGMSNAVTGVLIAYRALDTLLEKVVLLLAVAGVWSLSRDGLGRPAIPAAEPADRRRVGAAGAAAAADRHRRRCLSALGGCDRSRGRLSGRRDPGGDVGPGDARRAA